MSLVRRAESLQIWYSKETLFRHGPRLGYHGRMRIQQPLRLAWIYASPLVQTWYYIIYYSFLVAVPPVPAPGSTELSAPSVRVRPRLCSFLAGINSHWEVLEATRPIGIVHIRETHANQTQAAGPAPQAAATPAAPAASNVSTASLAPSTCRKNTSVSLYLPRRLHSNPPRAGIGAVRQQV